jgi:integrase
MSLSVSFLTIEIKSGLAYLSQNSASAYFNKFKAALRQAFIDGYLTVDINRKIKSIKEEQTQRDFLTAEELNKLVKTNCNNPLLKRAALFSALTGLRFSDIKKLKWKEVNKSTELGDYISFRTKKTKDPEIIPISEQAVKLMGNAGDAESNVFEGLEYSAYANKHLYQWIGAAGITKDITFHCFRHTYATLQLASGTDLWTVSKLLGHKSVKTTQIYAQIVNKAKKEAAGKIILDI